MPWDGFGVGAADSMLGMVGVELFGGFPREVFVPGAPLAPRELGVPRVFGVLADESSCAKRGVEVASNKHRRHEVVEVSRQVAKRGVFVEYGGFIPISLVSCQSVCW